MGMPGTLWAKWRKRQETWNRLRSAILTVPKAQVGPLCTLHQSNHFHCMSQSIYQYTFSVFRTRLGSQQTTIGPWTSL